ncbi:hypothetical protein CDAR_396871 [Caerostris darwini]|uniref:HSF-type DNA-binding domain-containing protein n=1 Tax=Caerostris darwini TaxID=1538125 RepID=A0AAV4WJR0_9ARAC|nr:hypothetical protein CDAR_396871 [Caerostris darwini]
MVSKELVDSLKSSGFPFKLYRLATSAEIKSIRWTKCGNAIMIDPVTIKDECFKQEILNMTSIGQVRFRLKYYNFEEMNEKSEPRVLFSKCLHLTVAKFSSFTNLDSNHNTNRIY